MHGRGNPRRRFTDGKEVMSRSVKVSLMDWWRGNRQTNRHLQKERGGAMKRILIPVALGLALIISSAAYAMMFPPTSLFLRGEYKLIGSRECVYAVGDFGAAPYFSIPSGGSTRAAHYNGLLQLYGDGTGSLDVRLMQINHQQAFIGGTPLTVWHGTCEVEYHDLADGTVEMSFLNCEGPVTAGAGYPNVAGSDLDRMSVVVSAGGDILMVSDTEPFVETTSYTVGSTTYYTKRICGRTGIAIRKIR